MRVAYEERLCAQMMELEERMVRIEALLLSLRVQLAIATALEEESTNSGSESEV